MNNNMNSNRGNNNNNNRRRGRGNNNNRQQGGGGGQQLNRVDSRARGNAPQMLEKYRKLAHDAHLNGDRVQEEYFLQFADHYFRVIADQRARQEELRTPRQPGERWQEGGEGEQDREQTEQSGEYSDDSGDYASYDRGQQYSRNDRPERQEPGRARAFRLRDRCRGAEEGRGVHRGRRGRNQPFRRLRRADAAIEMAVDIAAAALSEGHWSRQGPVTFDAQKFVELPAELALRLLGRAVAHTGDEGPVELGKLDAKLAAAKAAGAKHGVNLKTSGPAELLALSGGGLDGMIDFVGAPSTAALALPALLKGGRFVSVGLFGGAATIPLVALAMREIAFMGSAVGSTAQIREVVALVQSGKLSLPAVQVRPLAEAEQSLRDLEAGRITGRVVLEALTAGD